MLTEYGADANLAHQTEYLWGCPELGKAFFIRKHFRLRHMSTSGVLSKTIRTSLLLISGTCSIFAVPMWTRGGVPARNMKGLITFDRKTKERLLFLV